MGIVVKKLGEKAKQNFPEHSDLYIENKDPGRHLKPWSEIVLPLLEQLNQLSVEFVRESQIETNICQAVSCSKSSLINNVFSGYAILLPNV